MDILIVVKIAVKALVRNKMRTFLTMLGIIIGVGAVVGMLGIARGAQYNITKSIESMGTNNMFISASSTTKGGVRGGWGSITTLKVEDSDAIQRDCPHVQYTTPFVPVSGRAIQKNKNWSPNIYGVNEYYPYIGNWEMENGGFFSRQDVISAAKVCVIGKEVEDNLYDMGEDPVGTIIRIERIPFKVVGVLKSKGASGGGDADNVVYIPYKTAMQRLYRYNYIPVIMASAVSREDSSKAKDEVESLLRQRHKIQKGGDDDFQIMTQAEIIKMVEDQLKIFTILLSAVASVSLLVGGIGIMNIMLVSVTERIREIGIRMAIGATAKDIRNQFLIEAVVLSILGGIFGIGLGYLITYFISRAAKWPVIVSPESILLALAFSSAVGIFFGFYPAWKASKLDPIDALRQE